MLEIIKKQTVNVEVVNMVGPHANWTIVENVVRGIVSNDAKENNLGCVICCFHSDRSNTKIASKHKSIYHMLCLYDGVGQRIMVEIQREDYETVKK